MRYVVDCYEGEEHVAGVNCDSERKANHSFCEIIFFDSFVDDFGDWLDIEEWDEEEYHLVHCHVLVEHTRR